MFLSIFLTIFSIFHGISQCDCDIEVNGTESLSDRPDIFQSGTYTSLELCIKGTLIVDLDWTLGTNSGVNVKMDANAIIMTEGAVNFTSEKANFNYCGLGRNGRWQSVLIQDGASYTSLGSSYDKGIVAVAGDNFEKITISTGVISNCFYGLFAEDGNEVRITNAGINNSAINGIFIKSIAEDITVNHNSINGALHAIRVENCNLELGRIQSNNFSSIIHDCLHITLSSNFWITSNDFNSGDRGLNMHETPGCNVSTNTFGDFNFHGAFISGDCEMINTFSKNEFSGDMPIGLYLAPDAIIGEQECQRNLFTGNFSSNPAKNDNPSPFASQIFTDPSDIEEYPPGVTPAWWFQGGCLPGKPGIKTNQFAKTKDYFSISPNPASTTLNISLPNNKSENTTIKVTDLAGKLMLIEHLNNSEGTFNLDISILQKGIYILHSKTENSINTTKFVKQ